MQRQPLQWRSLTIDIEKINRYFHTILIMYKDIIAIYFCDPSRGRSLRPTKSMTFPLPSGELLSRQHRDENSLKLSLCSNINRQPAAETFHPGQTDRRESLAFQGEVPRSFSQIPVRRTTDRTPPASLARCLKGNRQSGLAPTLRLLMCQPIPAADSSPRMLALRVAQGFEKCRFEKESYGLTRPEQTFGDTRAILIVLSRKYEVISEARHTYEEQVYCSWYVVH